jgi:hypothetical protein
LSLLVYDPWPRRLDGSFTLLSDPLAALGWRPALFDRLFLGGPTTTVDVGGGRMEAVDARLWWLLNGRGFLDDAAVVAAAQTEAGRVWAEAHPLWKRVARGVLGFLGLAPVAGDVGDRPMPRGASRAHAHGGWSDIAKVDSVYSPSC